MIEVLEMIKFINYFSMNFGKQASVCYDIALMAVLTLINYSYVLKNILY